MAVIWVEDVTLTFDTEMFDPAFTVVPTANPVPLIVTLIAVPTKPCAGEIPVINGVTFAGPLPPALQYWLLTLPEI